MRSASHCLFNLHFQIPLLFKRLSQGPVKGLSLNGTGMSCPRYGENYRLLIRGFMVAHGDHILPDSSNMDKAVIKLLLYSPHQLALCAKDVFGMHLRHQLNMLFRLCWKRWRSALLSVYSQMRISPCIYHVNRCACEATD